jgi:ketosteroid isomerase-like protein
LNGARFDARYSSDGLALGRRKTANMEKELAGRLKALVAAFNAHDLDAIMGLFAEDCVLEMPRGEDPWGTRFVGRDAVRDGLAARFEGLPDVHYDDDDHWVCDTHGVSKWLLTGTADDGRSVCVRGCDLFDFAPDGTISRKDSYWKIVAP